MNLEILPGGHCLRCHKDYPDTHDYAACERVYGAPWPCDDRCLGSKFYKSKRIPLTHGKYAIVDDEDFAYLSRFEWLAQGTGSGNFYAVRRVMTSESKAFLIPIEYFIMPSSGTHGGARIVHKNHDSLDCRKENIEYRKNEVAVHNKRKTTKPKTSRYKGVSLNTIRGKNGLNPWVAKIGWRYKSLWIGAFATEEEAAVAYNKKARELYGDQAYQNEI